MHKSEDIVNTHLLAIDILKARHCQKIVSLNVIGSNLSISVVKISSKNLENLAIPDGLNDFPAGAVGLLLGVMHLRLVASLNYGLHLLKSFVSKRLVCGPDLRVLGLMLHFLISHANLKRLILV